MDSGECGAEAELLHLLATLHWEDCHTQKSVRLRHCAVLHDRLAILSYKYHPSTDEYTDLFASDTGLQWQLSLPPMATKHSHTSSVRTRSPEVLVVDAGLVSGGRKLDVVEVLLGDQSVDHIPDPCLDMHSMFHDGNLYFLGGRQGATVYTCTCASLMSSCGNNTTTSRPLWRTFKAPDCNTAAVSYSSCLVSINDFCTIGAYSSWVEATSTGESSFDPDSQFITNVLSRLEAVMGIQTVSALANIHCQVMITSGVQLPAQLSRYGRKIVLLDPPTDPSRYVEEVFSQLSARRSRPPPTWIHLLEVLRDIGLLELSQQIDTFMEEYLAHLFLSDEERKELDKVVIQPQWLISVMKDMKLDADEDNEGIEKSLVVQFAESGDCSLNLLKMCWKKYLADPENPSTGIMELRHLCLLLPAYCLISPLQTKENDKCNILIQKGGDIDSRHSESEREVNYYVTSENINENNNPKVKHPEIYLVLCRLPNQDLEATPEKNFFSFYFDFKGFLPAKVYHRPFCILLMFAGVMDNVFSRYEYVLNMPKNSWKIQHKQFEHVLDVSVVGSDHLKNDMLMLHGYLADICHESHLEGLQYVGGISRNVCYQPGKSTLQYVEFKSGKNLEHDEDDVRCISCKQKIKEEQKLLKGPQGNLNRPPILQYHFLHLILVRKTLKMMSERETKNLSDTTNFFQNSALKISCSMHEAKSSKDFSNKSESQEEVSDSKDVEQSKTNVHTEAACPYESLGCDAVLLRKDIVKHKKDAHNKHIDLMLDMISSREESLQALSHQSGLVFEVSKYARKKEKNEVFCCKPFYTSPGGYRMSIRVDANGCNYGKGLYVSVFAKILEGRYDDQLPWPFLGIVKYELLNQLTDDKHFSKVSILDGSSDMDIGRCRGYIKFIPQAALLHDPTTKTQYLLDDKLYFRVSLRNDNYKPWLDCNDKIAVDLNKTLKDNEALKSERVTVFKVANYRVLKSMNDAFTCTPFYTHSGGYYMCIDVFPNGRNSGEKNCLSVYSRLLNGIYDASLSWPFRGTVTFTLLNQLEDKHHYSQTLNYEATNGSVWGKPKFVSHAKLSNYPVKNTQYLKNDMLYFRIALRVNNPKPWLV